MRSRFGAGIGLGLYTAGLVALALQIASEAADLGLSADPLVVGLAVGLVAAFVGAVAVRRLEALCRDRVVARVVALPLLGGLGAVVLALGGTSGALGLGVIGAGTGLLGTFLLRTSVLDHRARRLAGESARLATLPARSDRSWTRWSRAQFWVLGGLWFVIAAGSYAEGSGRWPLHLLLGLGFLASGLNVPRQPVVTEAGVRFETRFASRLLEWNDVAGYHLDDELVLLRPQWWHGDVPFDADEVDAEAVEAIDRFLPRSRTRTIPTTGLVHAEQTESESTGGA